MIKVSKATMDCVRRFPQLYKMQAFQVIDKEVRDAISITADAFVMAAMIALVEDFGFGTKAGSTRLYKFVEKMQTIIDFGAEQYDTAVSEGLRNRLQNLGVEYVGDR